MNVDLRRSLHRKVVSHLDSRNTGLFAGEEEEWRVRAEEFLDAEMKCLSLSGKDKDTLCKGILDEVFAYGPITGYLQDPSVSEVMVNGKEFSVVRKREVLSDLIRGEQAAPARKAPKAKRKGAK